MSEQVAEVYGEVAREFEAVRDAFRCDATYLGGGGGAFTAYVDGERVVDLWAGEAKA